jgi:hypothetical protein
MIFCASVARSIPDSLTIRLQARLDEIQRHLAALPRLAALRSFRERLQPLADLPLPPLAWSEDLPELQKEEIELGLKTGQSPTRSGDLASKSSQSSLTSRHYSFSVEWNGSPTCEPVM